MTRIGLKCELILAYKEAARKMLVKVTPGVNFINILTLAAFMCPNALVLNFYFIKTSMLVVIHYLKLILCPTFILLALSLKHKHKSSLCIAKLRQYKVNEKKIAVLFH